MPLRNMQTGVSGDWTIALSSQSDLLCASWSRDPVQLETSVGDAITMRRVPKETLPMIWIALAPVRTRPAQTPPSEVETRIGTKRAPYCARDRPAGKLIAQDIEKVK